MLQSNAETLSDATGRERWQPDRIIALLYERRLRNEGAVIPLLLLEKTPCREIPGTERLRVSELLAQWPQTVPERIERSFLTLVRRIGVDIAGKEVKIEPSGLRRFVPLAIRESEAEYFFKAMQQYGWITQTKHRQPRTVGITPEGWEKFHSLTGASSDDRNPVFVAMWFGGKERKEKMDRLWLDFIRPAIEAARYRAKRADTDEHNEPIMDRVIADIRRAPFVVAELSDDNNGVYYEAGFAKGRGIEVIYCCREEHKPHFDVTGINLVKWKDEADLRKRLEDRVIGSQDNGPYDYSELSRPLRAEDGASDDHS